REAIEMAVDVLGAPVKRKEDPRFIRGEGNYVDDIKLSGMVYAAVLRSPYAHANIRSVDTSRAKGLPGVVGVYTGQDFVDYEPLPAVVDAEKATQPGAPQLHENAPNNIVFTWTLGNKDGTDEAFAKAEVVVRQRIINQRLIPNAMETRGDIGWYNPGNDDYTEWMSSQTPHIQRLLLTAFVTGIPEHKLRVIAPDVGGAFGSKIYCYADMAMVLSLSKKLGGRPVKWIETRRENYNATTHGRDHITDLELASTREGTVTALRVKTYANLGGRLSTIAAG